MNQNVLNVKVQQYIQDSLEEDLKRFVFKKSPFGNISAQELTEQIYGKITAKTKLPTWYNTPNIYYPAKLNLEQTSSEKTARYKASLFKGARMADLTGGFGVDSYFFSKQFDHCDYFEQDQGLCAIATHNFKALKASNITTHCTDGLTGLDGHYDLIYLDPARRDAQKSKVFRLEDCSPNVMEQIDLLLKRAQSMVIKTSPMLDISLGIEQLQYVSEVYAIAVNNELKELLWILNKDASSKIINMYAVNLLATANDIDSLQWQANSTIEYSLPKQYVYIPNPALMKLGQFGYICEQYKVEKLHKDSHFFTSDNKIDFPGRCLQIETVDKYNKNSMKEYSKTTAMVISRNFPLTVAALRKRWKIADGGNKYLIFTTLVNDEKAVLQCSIT